MARRLDPTVAAQNWVTGLGSAGQKIQHGVQSVSEAPGVKAARNAGGYLNGVQGAVQKWQRKVAAVSLGDWQQAMLTKGVPRVAQGAQAGQAKFAASITPLFQYMSSGLSQIDNMPNDTPAARDSRMLAWVNYMRNYQGTG